MLNPAVIKKTFIFNEKQNHNKNVVATSYDKKVFNRKYRREWSRVKETGQIKSHVDKRKYEDLIRTAQCRHNNNSRPFESGRHYMMTMMKIF